MEFRVNEQPAGTLEWSPTFAADVSAAQSSGPVLCERHNGMLSLADSEATKLSEALRNAAERMRSQLVHAPLVSIVNGYQFGRWLCKAYVGCSAMNGQRSNDDFIRYAFGEPTTSRLYFLFPAGPAAQLGDTRNLQLQGYRTTERGPEAFRVLFEGLVVVVSSVRDGPGMEAIFEELPFPEGTEVIDRLRRISLPTIEVRIDLDWSGDPDDPRLLDPTGMPVSRRR
jgi:hypothetical protein